jgi:hypothetical protein
VVTGVGGTTGRAWAPNPAPMGRELLTIDGKPAAEVYNQWLDGALQPQLDGGGVILAQTAAPAGGQGGPGARPVALPAGAPRIRHPGPHLAHLLRPAGGRPPAGHARRPQPPGLPGRPGGGPGAALPAGQTVAGALIVYCGGCRMAVARRCRRWCRRCGSAGPVPFLGCFTFGEQGWLLDLCTAT